MSVGDSSRPRVNIIKRLSANYPNAFQMRDMVKVLHDSLAPLRNLNSHFSNPSLTLVNSSPLTPAIRKTASKRGLQTTLSTPCHIMSQQNLFRMHPRNLTDKEYYRIKSKVQEAIIGKRIFLIDPPPNDALATALTERGWLQKLLPWQFKLEMSVGGERANSTQFSEIQIIQEMLQDIEPNFIWTLSNWERAEADLPLCNRLQKKDINFDFSCKVSLAALSQQVHWADADNSYAMPCIFPRTYFVANPNDLKIFTKDFRLTICTNFLYYLHSKLHDLNLIFDPNAIKTTDCIFFALRHAAAAIQQKLHSDLDENVADASAKVTAKTFATYFDSFTKIIKNGLKMKILDDITPSRYRDMIRQTVQNLLKYYPDIPHDGYRNVWIIKPIGFSCGYGIAIANREDEIARIIGNKRYLLQKYMEKPLLVHNSKFDIRQYILLTMRADSLFVWIYKNCYLKFSSQEYSLENFSPAIHVTNHTIQKRLRIGNRSRELPATNMWVLEDLLAHLSVIGKPHAWVDRIFPGIISGVKQIVGAALEGLEYVENNFQLFGADFLITENYVPVLLEINSAPDLTYSTPVTKVICADVVEDLAKVVIDRRTDPNCCTGDFQNIMEINMKSPAKFREFTVYGRKMKGKRH